MVCFLLDDFLTVHDIDAFLQAVQGFGGRDLCADAEAGEGIDIHRCGLVGHGFGDAGGLPIPKEEVRLAGFRCLFDGQVSLVRTVFD